MTREWMHLRVLTPELEEELVDLGADCLTLTADARDDLGDHLKDRGHHAKSHAAE